MKPPSAVIPDGQRCLTYGKYSWTTRKKARKAARQLAQIHGNVQTEYHCDACGNWHMTTKHTPNTNRNPS